MRNATLIRDDNPPIRFELENVSVQRPDGGPVTFSATSGIALATSGSFQLVLDGALYDVRKLQADKKHVGAGTEHAVSGELVAR